MEIRGGSFSCHTPEQWRHGRTEKTTYQRHDPCCINSKSGPQATGFLDLPAELREQIYAHLILRKKNTITVLFDYDNYINEVSAQQPPITQVCRLIRHETLPVFYSANIFSAQLDQGDYLATAKQWLRAIGDRNVAYLKRICFCGWTVIPSGHTISRRFVRVQLGLRDGMVGFEESDEEHPDVVKHVEALKKSFGELVQHRRGEPFDAEGIGQLMEGFRRLCTIH